MSVLEEVHADVAALIEEYGLNDLLGRYGLRDNDLVRILAFADGDLHKAATLAHGVLVGLALGETRTKETIQ